MSVQDSHVRRPVVEAYAPCGTNIGDDFVAAVRTGPARFHPEDRDAERIDVVIDEDVMGGEPCIERTRIPVGTIVANVKAGHSPDSILASYPAPPVGSLEAAFE